MHRLSQLCRRTLDSEGLPLSGASAVAEREAERRREFEDVAVGAAETLAEDDRQIVEQPIAHLDVALDQPVEVVLIDLQQLAILAGGDGRRPLGVAEQRHLAKELRSGQAHDGLSRLLVTGATEHEAQPLGYFDGAPGQDEEREAILALAQNLCPGSYLAA